MLKMGSPEVERRLEEAEAKMQVDAHLVQKITYTLGFIIALFNGHEFKMIETFFISYLNCALRGEFIVEPKNEGIHIYFKSTMCDYYGLYRIHLEEGKVSFANYSMEVVRSSLRSQSVFPLLPPLDQAKLPDVSVDCSDCPLAKMATEKF